MELELVIQHGKLCDGVNPTRDGQIGIANGKIAVVASNEVELNAQETIDAHGYLVTPGIIDPHVHLGHGDEHASEFWTEGRSALIGGITTLLTFYRKYPFTYLNFVPELLKQGEENSPIDFLVHLPLYTRDNLEETQLYYSRLGIRGFKFFPGIRGDDAAKMTDLPHTGPMLPIDDSFVYEGMNRVGQLPGAIALYHAENPDINASCAEQVKAQGRNDLQAWCDSRPDFGEAESVLEAVYWQRVTGCPLYVVHVSSAAALEVLAEEKRKRPNAKIWVESCPQYLSLTRDATVGTLAKMSPPLRTNRDQDRLWEGVANGEIDTIATDHGAFKRADKQDAWHSRSGFPGMATMLPAMVTYGLREGRVSQEQLIRSLSVNSAKIFGIYPRKGSFVPGADADVCVIDLETPRIVDPARLESRSDFSVYEGQQLYGWPRHVIRRGAVLVRDGEISVSKRGGGRYLGWENTK